MHFELFLAQQNVQKAKLAKCISTALHYTHRCCTEIQYKFICLDVIPAWLVQVLGVGTCFCACEHVQSDSLEFMGDERGS